MHLFQLGSLRVWWLNGKKICLQCRRHRRCKFDPWVGKIPWRRKWQPTPVFLPEKSQEHRSLAGCSPRGLKELDMTEHWSQREPQLARCARELPFKWMLQSHASLYTIGAQDDILTATSGEVLKQNSKPLLEAWHHEKVWYNKYRKFSFFWFQYTQTPVTIV